MKTALSSALRCGEQSLAASRPLPLRASFLARASARVRLDRWALLVAVGLSVCATACNDPKTPSSSRSEQAEQWFQRAQQDFGELRVPGAHEAIQKALAIAPADPEIRLLAGRIALLRLEYDEALRLLAGMTGSEVHGLRGRAHWYRGELSAAAEEFEKLLDDPSVRDEWAKSVVLLARRGEGRHPYTISGDPRAVVEMAQVSDVAPYLVVPVEIDGEDRLALVSTGIAEVVVDSATFAEPSWVSMRFKGKRIGPELEQTPGLEVSDVPALTQDLTGISKEVNAPISALLGASLLRNLNVTVDYGGHQFVVRNEPAAPPPSSTKLDVYYAKGGAMLLNAGLGTTDDARATLFVDSAMRFPIALDDRGWMKAGLVPNDLQPIPADPSQKLKGGTVPTMRFGAFRVDQVPGVAATSIPELEKSLALDVDGIMGVPLLAMYRVTFGDEGRVIYLEDDAELQRIIQAPPGALGSPEALPGAGTVPGGPINQGQSPLPMPQLPGPGQTKGPTPSPKP